MNLFQKFGKQCALKIMAFIEKNTNETVLQSYIEGLEKYKATLSILNTPASYLYTPSCLVAQAAIETLIQQTKPNFNVLTHFSELLAFIATADFAVQSDANYAVQILLVQLLNAADLMEITLDRLEPFVPFIIEQLTNEILAKLEPHHHNNPAPKPIVEIPLSHFLLMDIPSINLFTSRKFAEEYLQSLDVSFSQSVFVIERNSEDTDWTVYYYDLEKRPLLLVPNPYLKKLLDSLKDNKLPHPNLDKYDFIKYACCISKEDNVYIFETVEKAAEFASLHPLKYVFSLTNESGKAKGNWRLAEHSSAKKITTIPLPFELQGILSYLSSLPDTDSELYLQIKTLCEEIAKRSLDKVIVKQSKESAEYFLTPKNKLGEFIGSYVLTQDKKLIRVSGFGEASLINFDTSPQLAQWRATINSQEEISLHNIDELKLLLRDASQTKITDNAKKNNLLNCLQRTRGINLVVTDETNLKNNYIYGTFVLVKNSVPPVWKLYKHTDKLVEMEITIEIQQYLRAEVLTKQIINNIENCLKVSPPMPKAECEVKSQKPNVGKLDNLKFEILLKSCINKEEAAKKIQEREKRKKLATVEKTPLSNISNFFTNGGLAARAAARDKYGKPEDNTKKSL